MSRPSYDKVLCASYVAMYWPSPCHVNYSASYSNILAHTVFIHSLGLFSCAISIHKAHFLSLSLSQFEPQGQNMQRLCGSIHPPASSCILVCVSACRFHIGSTFNYSALTKYRLITRYLVSLKPWSWHWKVISTGMHECAKLSKKCWQE